MYDENLIYDEHLKKNIEKMKNHYKNKPVSIPDALPGARIVSSTRYPVVLIRGKDLTREETIKLVASEEPLFRYWDKIDLIKEEVCYDICYDRRWGPRRVPEDSMLGEFLYQGRSCAGIWILTDGTLGGSFIAGMTPYAGEYLYGWIELGLRHPELDMVVAYTSIDRNTCCRCQHCDGSCCNDISKKCEAFSQIRRKFEQDSIWNLGYPYSYEALYGVMFDYFTVPYTAYQQVQLAIHLNYGKITVLDGEDARNLYKHYNDRYGDHTGSMLYSYDWHMSYNKILIADENFIKECFKEAQLSEECYDIALEKKLIKEPEPYACLVTRKWIEESHQKMCEKYNITLPLKEN